MNKENINNELLILGKKILVDKSELVYTFDSKSFKESNKSIEDYFIVKDGNWTFENDLLIGKETGNKGGIIYTNKSFPYDVLVTVYMKTILPATRDVNAVWCSNWDEKTNYLGDSYVCGLNGWYEGLAGIERSGENGFYVGTSLYKYEPGKTVKMQFGSISGHCFLFVDDKLIMEIHDPHPLTSGYVGISPYCTCLGIYKLEVRKIVYENRKQFYTPEF